MASYIVLEPTDAVKLKNDTGDHTVFVRDEFTLFALIMPFLWLLTHRLWWHALMIALIGWGALSVLGSILASYLPSTSVVAVLSLLLSLFVALEGRNWYLAALRFKGYEEVALISAPDLTSAETVYFYGASSQADRKQAEVVYSESSGEKSTLTGNLAPCGENVMIGLVEYRGRL